jgi:hypothetical protein
MPVYNGGSVSLGQDSHNSFTIIESHQSTDSYHNRDSGFSDSDRDPSADGDLAADSESEASMPERPPKRAKQLNSHFDQSALISELRDATTRVDAEHHKVLEDTKQKHDHELADLKSKYDRALVDLSNAERNHERRVDDMIHLMKNNERRSDELITSLRNRG